VAKALGYAKKDAMEERTGTLARLQSANGHCPFEDAYRVPSRRQDAIKAGEPVPVAVTAATISAWSPTTCAKFKSSSASRGTYLLTMMQVENPTCLPDEPPVQFPPAHLERHVQIRKEKYESSA